MKKICLIILLSLTSCASLLVNNSSVESITIEKIKTGSRIEITDQSQISHLLKLINSSSKEFFISKGKYRITIKYRNKEMKVVLFSDNMIKIDGVTYKTSEKLNCIIEKYFEDELDL